MKRDFLFLTFAVFAANNAIAADEDVIFDSTRVEQLQEVVVNGVRAQTNAPYAITNIKREQLTDFSKTGRELPFLFSQTPGVMAWSENGTGAGTTYLRIRGAGDSRINVTLDGVPLNSPEDQSVFWVNMNSYGALLSSVQIQRGVGTSTNGDGAFGGTVALSTSTPSLIPSLELTASYGSFNTLHYGGKISSGLIANHLIIDAAYNQTTTDGFIHGTKANSGSYYGGLMWMGNNLQIRYKNIGNFEKTGQAWNGVTAGDNDMSLMDGTYGTSTGIKNYDDMWNCGLGKYNSLYEYLVYDEDGNFATDEDGNYQTARYQMADGSYWDRTTDNFWQDHNILSFAWNVSENLSTTASLHYTYGYGYYEEFRPNNKLKKFGFENIKIDSATTIKKTDFVRKKGLSQNTFGIVWNAKYENGNWNIIGGVALQDFIGNHFGYVTYAKNETVRQKYLSDGRYKYYDSDADKLDGSAFVKMSYNITELISVFGDIQYRHVGYKTDGINDKFYEVESSYYNQQLDIDKKYDFWNPKAGFNYNIGANRFYGSFAISHREPERNNFTDNGKYAAPKAESVFDYEIGHQYTSDFLQTAINLYYMDYKNQFVQTGEQSDIGENLTTNIKKSHRAGVELQAEVNATQWLNIAGNAALSVNKIENFDEIVEDWDNGSQTNHYSNSTLAFSPSTILNGFVTLHHKGWQAVWHTGYVSRQYLDNTECKDRSLPAYSVSDINLSYTLKLHKVLKEAIFGLNFNNVFDRHYASSGWVYSAICESAGHTNDNRYYQIGFIPMAGFSMMGNITLKF